MFCFVAGKRIIPTPGRPPEHFVRLVLDPAARRTAAPVRQRPAQAQAAELLQGLQHLPGAVSRAGRERPADLHGPWWRQRRRGLALARRPRTTLPSSLRRAQNSRRVRSDVGRRARGLRGRVWRQQWLQLPSAESHPEARAARLVRLVQERRDETLRGAAASRPHEAHLPWPGGHAPPCLAPGPAPSPPAAGAATPAQRRLPGVRQAARQQRHVVLSTRQRRRPPETQRDSAQVVRGSERPGSLVGGKLRSKDAAVVVVPHTHAQQTHVEILGSGEG